MGGYTFPVIGDSRITSPFGHRESPGGIGSTNHRGIDIGAEAGRGIIAPIGGQVIFADRAGGYGNQVKILGTDGLTHSFSHLQGFEVRDGINLQAGQLIGYMGATGNATGPHLHYEVRDKAGNALNPSGVLNGALRQGKDALIGAASNLLGSDALSQVANVFLPGSGFALDAFDLAGDGCGVNPICHLRKWIEESGFFQRLALAILAFIVIAGSVYMMKSNVLGQALSKAKGSIA